MKQMKKSLLYIALALLATATVGCEEADNGAANDTLPVVTIYDNWEPEEAYDTDVDCPLRIIPNAVAESCYVLPELIADKEAYIAAQGEDAYLQHVIDNGTKFDETLEEVFTDLKGDYAITIVAVAGNQRQAYEYVFNGVVWLPAGKGYAMTNIVTYMPDPTADPTNSENWDPYDGEVELYRKSNSNEFYVANLFEQISKDVAGWELEQEYDQRLYFTFDANKKLVSFTPEGSKYVFAGDPTFVGYWDPTGQYSSYHSIAQPTAQLPFYQITMLGLDVQAGELYINQRIFLNMDDAEWYDAE